jgi:hypothetical protein
MNYMLAIFGPGSDYQLLAPSGQDYLDYLFLSPARANRSEELSGLPPTDQADESATRLAVPTSSLDDLADFYAQLQLPTNTSGQLLPLNFLTDTAARQFFRKHVLMLKD